MNSLNDNQKIIMNKEKMDNELNKILQVLCNLIGMEHSAADVALVDKIEGKKYVSYTNFINFNGKTSMIEFYFDFEEMKKISRIHYYSSPECDKPRIVEVFPDYDETLAEDIKMLIDDIKGIPPENGLLIGEDVFYEIDDDMENLVSEAYSKIEE